MYQVLVVHQVLLHLQAVQDLVVHQAHQAQAVAQAVNQAHLAQAVAQAVNQAHLSQAVAQAVVHPVDQAHLVQEVQALEVVHQALKAVHQLVLVRGI